MFWAKLILWFSAILAATVAGAILWKEGRVTSSDLIAVCALIVSVVLVGFTFFSRTIPPNPVAQIFDVAFAPPDEDERKKIIYYGIGYDVLNGLSPEGISIKESIIDKIDGENRPDTVKKVVDYMNANDIIYDYNESYFNEYIFDHIVGKSPFYAFIVLGCIFDNKSPNPTTIDDIMLKVDDGRSHLLYAPFYEIKPEIFYTKQFNKTQDYVKDKFHPFELAGDNKVVKFIWFAKVNSCDYNGVEDKDLELNLGDTTVTLFYEYNGVTRSVKSNTVTVTKKVMLDVIKGGVSSFYQPNRLVRQLKKDLCNKN